MMDVCVYGCHCADTAIEMVLQAVLSIIVSTSHLVLCCHEADVLRHSQQSIHHPLSQTWQCSLGGQGPAR